ncbi:MAG TPA: ATP-binding protein [Deinococcales bacterium]|nr:ATP-binding protein [Deinococcales bacterium]
MNRIAVRLVFAMLAVVLTTVGVLFALTAYTNEQRLSRMSPELRSFLQMERSIGTTSSLAGAAPAASPPVAGPNPDEYYGPPKPSGLLPWTQALSGTPAQGGKGTLSAGPRFNPSARFTAISLPPRRGVLDLLGPDRVARNYRDELTWTLIIGAVIAAVVGASLAMILAARIAKPIEAVSRAAKRMAAGDTSARVPVAARDPRHGDETLHLALEFNRMADALESQELERKNMIADIAHELRTPLTVLQSRLEAMLDGVLPVSEEELTRLHRQTGLLARLVADLRTLSLADAGRLEIERRAVDLASVATAVVAAFQTRAHDKGVTLSFSPDGEGPTINGDPDRLSQVLTNLLDNALKFTPSGGTIRVGTRQADRMADLFVVDSGPGIPEQSLPHVFDRFYRAPGSGPKTPGERTGSGLGLAIARTLVELHGGKVLAANEPNGGARFDVSLPIG